MAAHPDRVALRTPANSVHLTWAQYGRRVRDLAAKLAALGVRRGDRVVLLLAMRPDAAVIDAAAMHLGAIGVSLYLGGTPAAPAYVLEDTEARVLVTERALAPRVAALRRACPALEHVVGVDGAAPGVPALQDVDGEAGLDFETVWRATRPEDVITIMYTSGTTGAPKGTVYSHGAVARAMACLDAALPPVEDLSTIAFIPFAHAGQRAMVHYRGILHAGSTTYCADPASLPAAILDARPTGLFAPPAVWERVAAGAGATIAADPDPAHRDATRAALARALAQVRERRAGRGAAGPHVSGEEGLLAEVRVALGLDRLAHPIVSAAPSPDEVLELLHAIGVPVMNLYALTELPPITVTRPDAADIGTAGRPLPGVALRLGSENEVLARHPGASSGYHRRPAQTAALFDPGGWGHTGDVGTLDDEGRLRLEGRRDERMATSLGSNIDPVRIELALCNETPVIAHACVVGDRRPYLVALLTVDPSRRDGDEDIAAAVERVNERLPEVARIRRFLVLDDTWAPGSNELTPTLKLRRKAIHQRYREEIAALYGPRDELTA